MLSFKVLLCALALTLLEIPVESGSIGGGTPNQTPELSGEELRALLRSRVVRAQKMKRPLDGAGFMLGPYSHSGVKVTLEGYEPDDEYNKWLIHKGDDFGISTNTVVVRATHMSSKWRVVETKEFSGRKTVSDFVRVGGSEYTWWDENCHDATNNMMNQ